MEKNYQELRYSAKTNSIETECYGDIYPGTKEIYFDMVHVINGLDEDFKIDFFGSDNPNRIWVCPRTEQYALLIVSENGVFHMASECKLATYIIITQSKDYRSIEYLLNLYKPYNNIKRILLKEWSWENNVKKVESSLIKE